MFKNFTTPIQVLTGYKIKNMKIFEQLKISIFENFKHHRNCTQRVVPMVFEFFKNIDFQGLQTSLKVDLFSLFHSQTVLLCPPNAVKGLK